MTTIIELVARRSELKRSIKVLESELESVENQLKPIARDAFSRVDPHRGLATHDRDGVHFTRKLLRTDLKSDKPLETALFLAQAGLDVLSPGLVSKSKLDIYDPTYSDGRVSFKGEVIPELQAKPVYSFGFTAIEQTAGPVTVEDLS